MFVKVLRRVLSITLILSVLIIAAVLVFFRGTAMDVLQVDGILTPGIVDRNLYLFDYLQYFMYLLQNQFRDAALVVMIAYYIIIFSFIVTFSILFFAAQRAYKSHKKQRQYENLKEKYRQKVYGIITSPEPISPITILRDLELEDAKMTTKQQDVWVRMMVNVRASLPLEQVTETTTKNINALGDALNLSLYLVRTMRTGTLVEKKIAIESFTFLGIFGQFGVLARELNAQDFGLNKRARIFTARNSSNDSLNYLEPIFRESFNKIDAIKIFEIYQQRHDEGNPMPNFLSIISDKLSPWAQAALVYMHGYWCEESELKQIWPYMDSMEEEVRLQVVEALAFRRQNSAEKFLIDRFDKETKNIRITIMLAIFKLGSGRAQNFFLHCYQHAEDNQLRTLALSALYGYNEESRQIYEKLKLASEQKEDFPDRGIDMEENDNLQDIPL